MPGVELDLETFERKATEVADILRALANERRLMILCKLVEWGEVNVTSLNEAVGLSQSALSQHLARLRRDQLVNTRRAAQTIFYALAGREAGAIMETLYSLYCEPVKAPLPPETAPRIEA